MSDPHEPQHQLLNLCAVIDERPIPAYYLDAG